MKISVAMCTYNGSAFLPEQLESLLAQTRLPDELIVCDDRSKDVTADIIRDFAAVAPFPVRFHPNETNLGSTRNFERAIGLCTGDIISLCDQDDVWLPAKLQRFETEHLRDDNVGMVFCNAELVDENLNPLQRDGWEAVQFSKTEQHNFQTGNAFAGLMPRNVVTGCAMSFRSKYRRLVLPIPVLRHNMIHDYWIAILLAAVSKVVLIPDLLIKYRQHSKQQVGLPQPVESAESSMGLLERAQVKYTDSFLLDAERLEPVYARLRERQTDFPAEAALQIVNSYLTHLRARTGLPPQKIRRVPAVFRELATLRYHRHSKGMMSAAKDLLLTNAELDKANSN